MKRKNMNILRNYFQEKSVLLGWTGAGGFFTFEHLDQLMGMGLTGLMLLSSIVVQYYKILSMKNEERRKEELHRRVMNQPPNTESNG